MDSRNKKRNVPILTPIPILKIDINLFSHRDHSARPEGSKITFGRSRPRVELWVEDGQNRFLFRGILMTHFHLNSSQGTS